MTGARLPRFPGKAEEEVAGGLTAPMPGKIVAVQVAVGDRVERTQVLVVLEAMKMEHTVASPVVGKVEQLMVAVGDQVEEGALLVQVTEDEG